MKKKADMPSFLAILIVLLVVLIVLLVWAGAFYNTYKEKERITVCKKSVETSALGHIQGVQTISDIRCPTEYKEVKDKNEEEIKKIAADKIAECWYMMGRGKLELFDTSMLEQNRYCMLCANLEFKGDAKNKRIEHFGKYLAENNVPKKYLDKDETQKTYAEYITSYETTQNAVARLSVQTNDAIDTNTDYTIMFINTKKGHLPKIWASVIGGSTTAAVVFAGILLLAPEPTLTKAGAIGIIGGMGGSLLGYEIGSEKTADWESAVLLFPYEPNALKSLNCTMLPVKQQNK